ncbi:heat shock 70 kDa protein 12A-like [Ostrea edulis]|uniref:heat shock 70 kDa protein 12A-like n=1 Tax=Ostrea edulis TaxID=37623 RepID=UPI0024AF1F78|nr:heat shock 70 kDa protein 12A-like [Ostrea edulis]
MGDNYVMVAAIDFGTTYSGYAFSTREEFKKDPLKIHANQAWVSGQKYLLSLKTPTCLLLRRNGKFVSFGFDAENRFSDITLDGKQNEYLYFNRFKMKLHNNMKLTRDMMLEDISQNKFPAIQVFALSIEALKDHLLDILKTQGLEIKTDEIRWVLTVPAIWSDPAKQFMREAAKMAGLDKRLHIALEPEAASLFCQHLPVERLVGASKGFGVSRKGTKYMVIDLGGGTADITVHEKLEGNKLKELFKASGGACGGTSVDTQFYSTMTRIFGGEVMHSLQKERTFAYMDLVREFETAKRVLKPEEEGDKKVNLTIPYVTLNEICKEVLEEELGDVLKQSTLNDDISSLGDKFRIKVSYMKNMFQRTIEDIVQHIKNILQKTEAEDVSRLLLVGGFSESLLIQDAVKKAFPKMQIIIPEEAGLAVLKGAVIFGHQPDSISSRVIRYTYGVRITPEFDDSKHRNDKKFMMNDVPHCADVFSPFLKAGTEVPANHKVVDAYTTTKPFQDSMPVVIYYSEKESPMYVTDDGCKKLGVLDVKVPNPSADDHHLAVQYQFGDTELHMLAVEVQSKSPCSAKFDLI